MPGHLASGTIRGSSCFGARVCCGISVTQAEGADWIAGALARWVACYAKKRTTPAPRYSHGRANAASSGADAAGVRAVSGGRAARAELGLAGKASGGLNRAYFYAFR
jgi:hypothetical protein